MPVTVSRWLDRVSALPTRAADDFEIIRINRERIAKEAELARCSCPRTVSAYRTTTDPNCTIHGTPPAPEAA